MYRILIVLVLILFMILLIRAQKNRTIGFKSFGKKLFNDMLVQLKLFLKIHASEQPLLLLRKAFMALTVLIFLVLMLSSFIYVLIFGSDLSGFLLLVHVTAAPLFVLSLTVSVVLRAHDMQFSASDIEHLYRIIPGKNNRRDLKKSALFSQKVYFWLFTIFAIPAIISILLSMYPLFGTSGQIMLLNVHKFSVLVLVIIFGLYLLTKYSNQTEIKES